MTDANFRAEFARLHRERKDLGAAQAAALDAAAPFSKGGAARYGRKVIPYTEYGSPPTSAPYRGEVVETCQGLLFILSRWAYAGGDDRTLDRAALREMQGAALASLKSW